MTISLGPRIARSGRFKLLFADGMRLVEEAASYLDGPGRDDARALSPTLAEACSAESMRLTTRLMQIASWLLARRALIDGAGNLADRLQDSGKVMLAPHGKVSAPPVFLQLPLPLQRLTERSLRLQRRVLHLDRMVNGHPDETVADPTPLAQQHALLQATYGRPGS